MLRTVAVLIAATGAGLIAGSLMQRSMSAIIMSGRPEYQSWNSGGHLLEPAAGVVTFVMVFFAVLEGLKK